MELIGVVGWKNSGKTTIIAKLIPAIRAHGLSVSTIKHVHHEIDLDQPGKDTYLHRQSGAVDVVMFSESRWAIMHERRNALSIDASDLAGLLGHMTEVDLVLVEGFKNLPMRRIEVRGNRQEPAIREAGVSGVICVVTDGPADPTLPTFASDQIDEIADFIKEEIAANRQAIV